MGEKEMNCVECGQEVATVNHHVDYKKNETVKLCNSCHRKIHWNKNHKLYPRDPEDRYYANLNIKPKTHERFLQFCYKEGGYGDTADSMLNKLMIYYQTKENEIK